MFLHYGVHQCFFIQTLSQPRSLQQDLDAEFTAARLLISKMKGEVLGVIDKAKEAETNLTDQHKIIEQKEKEILEFR